MSAVNGALARRAPVVAPRPEGPPRTARPRLAPVPEAPAAARRSRVSLRPVTIAAALVVASLLAVVVGNMALAGGQVQLGRADSRITTEQDALAALYVKAAQAESPANVAASSAGLTNPVQELSLPWWPLTRHEGLPLFSSSPCCTLNPGR